MRSRRSLQKQPLGQLLNVVAGFLLAGLLLLFHVWLPIQAERAKKDLDNAEEILSERKAEFQTLIARYRLETSLMRLDSWARQNGPWQSARSNDIVIFYENAN